MLSLYEYNCNGYHRYGAEHCTAHRINEDDLDKLIYDELLAVKEQAMLSYQSIESDVKRWLNQKSTVRDRVKQLNETLVQLKNDQKEILLERIRDRERADIYTEMLNKCEEDIKRIETELQSVQNHNAAIQKRKSEIKETVDIIERIIQEGAISDANLRLLVDSIQISEKDKKLNIKINLNARFQKHTNLYDENGNVKENIFE